MAVAYQSVSTTSWAETVTDGNSLSISKPSGLAEGDLMIAHIGRVNSGNNTNNLSAATGWTTLANGQAADATSTVRSEAFYKVATSGDVAASTFDFPNNTGFNISMVCGAIYRITGQNGAPTSVGATSSGATPSFSNTITPAANNNLLLMLITGEGNGASGSVATYAIANDNPTWTERYDVYGSGDSVFGATDGDGVLAGATAPRVEATATGNSSAAMTGLTQKSACVIVEVSPDPDVAVSGDLVTITSSLPQFSIPATVSADLLTATFSTLTPSITTQTVDWTYESRPAESVWTIEDQ